MKRKFLHINKGFTIISITFLIIIILLQACANEKPPTGGPRDTTPPQVLHSEPEHLSVNFNDNEITIQFDEYFTLDNINQKLVVSPPLNVKPNIKIKGKKLIIKFNEDLLPNSTYILYFDDAIKDFNEGNTLNDFKFIFSTGSFIDSIALTGMVLDAYTHNPVKDANVMLHTNLSDSSFTNVNPRYIVKTDNSGKFVFNNLKDTIYNIFALVDQNNNKLYDHVTEDFAFMDKPFKVNDSINFLLYTCQAKDSTVKVLENTAIRLNTSRIILNKSITHPNIKFYNKKPSNYYLQSNYTNDTLIVYTKDIDTAFIVLFDGENINQNNIIDSLKIVVNNNKLIQTTKLNLKIPSTIYYKDKLQISFNNSINEVLNDTIFIVSKIDTISDTIPTKLAFVDDFRLNAIIDYNFNPDYEYNILMKDSSVIDINNLYNNRVNQKVTITDEKDFGNFVLKLFTQNESDSTNTITNIKNIISPNYIVQLTNNDKNIVYKEDFITFDKSDTIILNYNNLTPNNYVVRVIYDYNNDKKWTSGDYYTKTQPEPVIYPKTISVMAKWTIEEDVKIIVK
ncbi:MAG: Ig-like domain-containing protein [Bacteroidales bacterium]